MLFYCKKKKKRKAANRLKCVVCVPPENYVFVAIFCGVVDMARGHNEKHNRICDACILWSHDGLNLRYIFDIFRQGLCFYD